jgi:MFS family permease
MNKYASLRPVVPILVAAAVMLSLVMGLRQSLGLFVQPAVRDLSMTVADFTLAIAIQNLAWGVLQPFAGAWAARFGFRPVMLMGAVAFVLGMLALATATGFFGVLLGAGLLIGFALACCGSGVAMAVASRPVPAVLRSSVLGMVSAAGSLGAMISAPIGQSLSMGFGWRAGVFGFVVIALIIVPCAWLAGRVDKIPLPPGGPAVAAHAGTARDAARIAFRYTPFLIMTGAYFVCGLQLVFLTTHLPSYIAFCGLDPMLGAQALAVIGAFNVIGSLFFGWAGGRWSRVCCSAASTSPARSCWRRISAPHHGDHHAGIASLMGSVAGCRPLVSGMVADMFGLRWQAMIQGWPSRATSWALAGAFGGSGSSMPSAVPACLADRVSLGIAAGVVQVVSGLRKPPPPRWAPA